MKCTKCSWVWYHLDEDMNETLCECNDTIQTLDHFSYITNVSVDSEWKIIGKLKL